MSQQYELIRQARFAIDQALRRGEDAAAAVVNLLAPPPESTFNERDVISGVLRAHYPFDGLCWCGMEWTNLGNWSDHVAENVINATIDHR
jgi:hypothetical protein